MERFQFLEAQMVPALEFEFSAFKTQDFKDFKSFCQVLNKKTEFDDFAASHSRGFTLNKPAIL